MVPNGFDPHRELETIYTFKQSVLAMRQLSPVAEQQLREILNVPLEHPLVTVSDRLRTIEMIMNRAWGKPHTNVHVTTEMMSKNQSRVILQANNRDDVHIKTIESEDN